MNSFTDALSRKSSLRILVIKFRHHGDMLLTTPLINTLQATWPQAKIDVLLNEETRPMLQAHPHVHQVYGLDRNWKKQGKRYRQRREWHVMTTLRRQRYDVVLNLADQWKSALIARFTGAAIRIGFDFDKRRNWLWRRCYTHLAPVTDHQQQHTVEQNLSILAPLGVMTRCDRATMACSPEDRHTVSALLAQHRVSQDYIVIQPTSRWFYKCWSDEKMAATIAALRREDRPVILTAGPDPREQAMVEHILALLPDRRFVLSLAGQLTLTQLAALIGGARLFIGVDSVPMHMAAALQTPCIALFGPSKLTFWRPWQVKGTVLWAGDYGPLPDPDHIDTHTTTRYLEAIPVSAVLEQANRWLT
ncbi:putative lipopolysaccharide heptosyltransferase III [Pantoea sp. 1.19]|uniref:putative lipopolysaccharide heptosyltransferase III n=1 Tax=Pantoea sp. 1.19 TaxID=1925589 RepID=UPI000948F705|nr:putative lipopolysaccharide heptosyltransferase III [Pantoea sp. 1.19]